MIYHSQFPLIACYLIRYVSRYRHTVYKVALVTILFACFAVDDKDVL